MDSPPLQLAKWVRGRYRYPDALTHLKLQKLVFYCYGAVLAFDLEDEVGSVDFNAWKHGPVNTEIWHEYKDRGNQPIGLVAPQDVPRYPTTADKKLSDALCVYGLLDAWRLREQSHLELPWKVTYEHGHDEIPREALRGHFKLKFRQPGFCPEYLIDLGSFELDGIPATGFRSLEDLATALRPRVS